MAEEETKKKEVPKEESKTGPSEGKSFRPEKRVQNIIRLGETNLDGNRKLKSAILGVKGVSFSLSKAISQISGLGEKKVGDLSEEQLKKIEDMINHPEKYQIPSWLYNRRKDPETGGDRHLSVSQLELIKKLDIGREKKIRSYRGTRHIQELPVRGQRTRGSFRKGSVVGVSRKARAQRAAKSGK